MKRSDINRCIRDMEKLIRENGFHLPRSVTGRRRSGSQKDMSMTRSATICFGWDITDYGLGDWNKVALP